MTGNSTSNQILFIFQKLVVSVVILVCMNHFCEQSTDIIVSMMAEAGSDFPAHIADNMYNIASLS